jgi:hypothetical protein
MLVLRIRDGTEHRALIEPEQVGGAENYADHAPGGPGPFCFKGTTEDGEFADETVEERHAEGAERDDHVDGSEIRHGSGEAAEFGDEARVTALVEHADNQEKRAGGDAVVDLLDDAAGKAKWRERENAQGAEAEVADRGVGDQLFHVFLHHADKRTIDNGDDGEADHDAAVFVRGVGEHGQRKTQEAVCPHFQQNAGQDDQAGCGSFGMRVGKPRVEWEHRDFDGEGEEEAPEEPALELDGERSDRHLQDFENAECVRVEIYRQDGQEHDDRTGERVEEELDGGIEAALAAPDADEEIHRNEHYFPKDVEEHEIERHEDTKHAGLEEEEEDVIFLFAFLNGGPGREDRDKAEDGGEHDHEETQTVNTDGVTGANGGDPREVLDELKLGGTFVPVVAPKQRQRDEQAEKPENIADPAVRVLVFARDKEHEDRSDEGCEKNC